MSDSFSYLNEPIRSKIKHLNSMVSESSISTTPIELDERTIFADPPRIKWLYEHIRKQIMKMKYGNITPKYLKVSGMAYEQLLVYNFNNRGSGFMDKIFDLEIVLDPMYDKWIPIVMSDAKTELVNCDHILDIMGDYRNHNSEY